MFEKLTKRAVNVLTFAEDESRRIGHNHVGTEQVLVGLMREGTSLAARSLASFGLYVNNVRAAVKSIVRQEYGFVSRQIPYTPRAESALSRAAIEAEELGQQHIGPEHVLLGLLREGDGIAVRVVRSFGVEPDSVRSRVLQLVNGAECPAVPALPVEAEAEDDEYARAADREEALSNLYGRDNFVTANSIAAEMRGWLNEEDSVLGIYFNAPDDYLVVCNDGIYWHDGDAQTYIEYRLLTSVELPTSNDDPYLRLVLHPNHKVVMLPVLHETEDFPDFVDMYEFLSLSIRSPAPIIDIEEVQSKSDFISFLRHPRVRSENFERLAVWLEGGAPLASWLSPLGIAPEIVEDASVWRLIALILLKFPESASAEQT
jgi:hypothetical protein